MAFALITCPRCGCSVDLGQTAGKTIVCARCTNVFELQSDCSGSCSGCGQASKTVSCAETVPKATGLSAFRPGTVLTCTVLLPDTHGYKVDVGPEKLPGFIATDKVLPAGTTIDASVICVHQGRLLLALQTESSKAITSENLCDGSSGNPSGRDSLKALLQRLFHV